MNITKTQTQRHAKLGVALAILLILMAAGAINARAQNADGGGPEVGFNIGTLITNNMAQHDPKDDAYLFAIQLITDYVPEGYIKEIDQTTHYVAGTDIGNSFNGDVTITDTGSVNGSITIGGQTSPLSLSLGASFSQSLEGKFQFSFSYNAIVVNNNIYFHYSYSIGQITRSGDVQAPVVYASDFYPGGGVASGGGSNGGNGSGANGVGIPTGFPGNAFLVCIVQWSPGSWSYYYSDGSHVDCGPLGPAPDPPPPPPPEKPKKKKGE